MSKYSLAFWNGSEAGDRMLVGYTDTDGMPWWYSERLQGPESNVYAGPVPVGDALRRIFTFEPESLPVYVAVPATIDTMSALDADGNPIRFVRLEDRQAIAADDTHEVTGLFKLGYKANSFRTLCGDVANLLGGSVGLWSAGFTNPQRSVAFVQVRSPERVSTPEGVNFLPHLLVADSLDGSLSRTYKNVAGISCCDNTFSANIFAKTAQQVKVKHTKYSALRLENAQQVLGLFAETAETVAAGIKSLCEWEVTDAQMSKLLDKIIPVGESDRSKTMADKKRSGITHLYCYDNRAATWKGTAFGVLQAFDTYERYGAIVRGADRASRIMSNTIDGSYDKGAAEVLKALATV